MLKKGLQIPVVQVLIYSCAPPQHQMHLLYMFSFNYIPQLLPYLFSFRVKQCVSTRLHGDVYVRCVLLKSRLLSLSLTSLTLSKLSAISALSENTSSQSQFVPSPSGISVAAVAPMCSYILRRCTSAMEKLQWLCALALRLHRNPLMYNYRLNQA